MIDEARLRLFVERVIEDVFTNARNGYISNNRLVWQLHEDLRTTQGRVTMVEDRVVQLEIKDGASIKDVVFEKWAKEGLDIRVNMETKEGEVSTQVGLYLRNTNEEISIDSAGVNLKDE